MNIIKLKMFIRSWSHPPSAAIPTVGDWVVVGSADLISTVFKLKATTRKDEKLGDER